MKKNIFDSYYDWCILDGSCEPLHIINTIRFDYIVKSNSIKNKKILDIGCGGGILSKKLAEHGATVVGVDESLNLINLAKKNTHIKLNLKYIHSRISELKIYDSFDIILCMEVLEHLKQKYELLNLIKNVIKKDTIIIVSSVTKIFSSYLKVIFLGEYITKQLTKGTHQYENFLSIDYLNDLIKHYDLYLNDIKFIKYNPILKVASLTDKKSYNYITTLRPC